MLTILKWMWLPAVIALLLPQSSDHKAQRTPLERLQSKIDIVSVANLTPLEFAGQYTNPSEELSKRLPRMGSADLFIFPDKTYIFTFVTDIPPETISDKGTWSLESDILLLKSDKDITWKSRMVEHRHIVVRRRGHDSEFFLIGIDHQLPRFERDAKEDPEFTFLLLSLKREKTISATDVEPLRKKLMEEMWHPDFYR